MTKEEKQKHLLKLMVIAMNEAVNSGAIDLSGVSIDGIRDDKHKHLEIVIAGRPSVINWFDSGYDELRVSVWWDYQPDMMPTWRRRMLDTFMCSTPPVHRKYFRNILGACGTCYLERRSGKFIIGDEGKQFSNVYVREDSVYDLNQIPAEQPAGYAISGRVKE